VAASHRAASASCLAGPLIRVSPRVFISLAHRMHIIIHARLSFGRHLYMGTLDGRTPIYCVSSDSIPVYPDVEAERVSKSISL